MDNNINKTKKNIFFLTLSQIIAIVFGLIMPRLTITGYGSEVNGLLNSVSQIISYLILFEAGIQAVAKQSLYKTINNKEKGETNSILSAVNENYKRIGTLYLIFLFFLSMVYPLFTVSETLCFFEIFIIVFLSGIGNVISFFFQGKYIILLSVDGKQYILTIFSTFISIASHILKIILLLLGVNIVYVIIATAILSLMQCIFIMAYVRYNYKWIDLTVSPNKSSLKQSKYAFIHQIVAQIFAHTDVLLLTVFCNLKVVSVYSIYKMIVYYIRTALVIPLDSTIFALGQLYNKDKKKYIKVIDSFELLFSTAVFSIYLVTLYLLLPFLKIYTRGVNDINYIDSFLPILFILAEVLNLVRAPMSGTINFAGHFKETVSRSLLEMVINIIVSVVGVIFLGIYGVLIGTIVALLYRTVDIIIYANRKILNRSPLKTISFYLSNILLCLIVGFILSKIKVQIITYFDFFIVGLITTPIVVLSFVLIIFTLYKRERKFLIDFLVNFLRNRKLNKGAKSINPFIEKN